jgi:hypothetical protein
MLSAVIPACFWPAYAKATAWQAGIILNARKRGFRLVPP